MSAAKYMKRYCTVVNMGQVRTEFFHFERLVEEQILERRIQHQHVIQYENSLHQHVIQYENSLHQQCSLQSK